MPSLSLPEPYEPSATRPPQDPGDCPKGELCGPGGFPMPTQKASMVWVIGPVLAGIGLALLVVLIIICRRRRQPLKVNRYKEIKI